MLRWDFFFLWRLLCFLLVTECQQLIAWCLSQQPSDRPTLEQILIHPWVKSAEGQQVDSGGLALHSITADSPSGSSTPNDESLWIIHLRDAEWTWVAVLWVAWIFFKYTLDGAGSCHISWGRHILLCLETMLENQKTCLFQSALSSKAAVSKVLQWEMVSTAVMESMCRCRGSLSSV